MLIRPIDLLSVWCMLLVEGDVNNRVATNVHRYITFIHQMNDKLSIFHFILIAHLNFIFINLEKNVIFDTFFLKIPGEYLLLYRTWRRKEMYVRGL
jgi:hypothetical protein